MQIIPELGKSIPDDWVLSTLGARSSKIGSGATPKGGSSVYVQKGTALIRSQNVYDHEFKDEGLAFIDDSAAHALRGVTVQEGDVLINITGDSILRTTVVPPRVLPARVNQHVAIVRPDDSLCSAFVQKWLATPQMKDYMLGLSSGATRKAITKGHLSSLPIPIPPLGEQRAIAATLGALDDKIESNRRIAINIEQLIFAQFDSLFNVESSDGGVPISSLVGVNVKRKLDNGNEAVKIPMASLPEGAGSIFMWNREAVSGGARFVNGDVLFARITPCLENGKTAIVDMLNEGEIGFGSTEFIVLSPQGDISTSWIYALARNEAFRNWAQRNMTGSTGRQRFQAAYLDDYLVEPPAGEALNKFNESSEASVAMLTEKRNETLRLQALRDALLPELMSGRIRVAEACEAIDGEVGDVEIQ